MKKSIITLAILSCIAPLSVDAGKVSVDTVLDASWVNQTYSFANTEERQSNTLTVTPTVAMQYVSKKAIVNGSLSHVEQRTNFDNDIDSVNNDFTNFSINSSLTVIERLLSLSASTSQSYQSFDPNQFLISDFLTPDNTLNKVTRNTFIASSNIIQGDYFGGNASYVHSSFDVEVPDGGFNENRDTQSQRLSFNLYNGDALKSLTWSLDYSKSSSEQFTVGDFDSEFVQFSAALGLFHDIGISITAQDETNESTNDSVDVNSLREFSSVGLGLSYRPSPNRSLVINYNRPTSNDTDDETFVSGSVNWEFSPRTELVANVSKRFYGRSSNVQFNFNNRALRISAGRSESVTSNAQLFADGSTTTSFVCSTGAINLGDCFIPDTLDYQLGLGESFVNLEQPNFSFGDNIILRTKNFLNMSYQKRKLTLSFNALDNEDDSTFADDSSQFLTSQSFSLGLNYKAGVFTSFDLKRTESETETFLSGLSLGKGETKLTELSIERQLGRELFLTLTLSDIDRNGFLPGFSAARGEDYSDERLSLGIRYQPE